MTLFQTLKTTTTASARSSTTWCKAPPSAPNDMKATRRTFLQAVGVNLALPLLESTGLRAAELANAPRRMVAMNFALGLHGPNFFPEHTGAGYTPSPYLEVLGKELQQHMTVISGTSHPDVTLGHASDSTFL